MEAQRAEPGHGRRQRPGVLYPHRCLECPEMLMEDYGGRTGRCAECVRADLASRRAAQEDLLPDTPSG